MKAFLLWLIALVALGAVGCGGAPRPLCRGAVGAPAGGWPATAEGQVVAGYLDAYNSGSVARLRQFTQVHAAADAPPVLDQERRRMQHALRCLSPRAVEATAPHRLTLRADSATEGRFALDFAFDDAGRLREVRGQPAFPDESARTEAEAVATIVAYADELAAHDRFAGVIAIERGGAPVLARAWGVADRARGTPIDLDTRFNIASTGKMLTAAAILQLVRAGKLSLDDRLDRYVKLALPVQPGATIRQLLTHTSGFVDDYRRFMGAWTRLRDPADYVRVLGDMPPAFAAGAGVSYSNYGYVLLARVIEVVAKAPFATYLRDHVAAPAGMAALAFESGQVPAGHRAIPYAGTPLVDATPQLPLSGSGFGCEYATAADLQRFLAALVEHRLLDEATTRAMTTDQLVGAQKLAPGLRSYGFGIQIQDLDGVRAIGHDGGAPGVSSYARVLPERGYAIVVLANLDSAAARMGARIARLLARLPPTPPDRDPALAP